MRDFLEFHDSELLAAQQYGSDMCLALDGYVHRWVAGEGEGWMFKTTIVLRGVEGAIGSLLPVNIADGTLIVDGVPFENMVELPFYSDCACELTLETIDGKKHVLTGVGVEINHAPDGDFIEALDA